MENFKPFFGICMFTVCGFFCCSKSGTNPPTGNQPAGLGRIIGTWQLVSDSVVTTGDYYVLVNGVPNFPLNGNISATGGDYFQFVNGGKFYAQEFGILHDTSTYQLLADSVLQINSLRATLDSAKVTALTDHNLTIRGVATISTGQEVEIFYLAK